MKRPAIRRNLQIGIAALEAAILVIPLLILTFGIVDGGRALFEYNTLTKATRDSVRYLSTMDAGTGHAAATCLAVTGTTDCSAPSLVEGLVADNVSICDATNCPDTHHLVPSDGNGGTPTGVINLVTVTVSGFQFQSFAGMPFPSIVFGPVSATMRQAL